MSDWISREATIETFLPAGGLDYAHLSKKEIVAILRALPPAQPDAVSRDAVMQLLQEWTYCSDVEELVRALPAVQPDTPKGCAESPMITGLVASNMTVGHYDKPTKGNA